MGSGLGHLSRLLLKRSETFTRSSMKWGWRPVLLQRWDLSGCGFKEGLPSQTHVRGSRGVGGLSQKLCGMERLRLRGFGEDRSYTIQGFQGLQAFLHCSPN